MAEFKDSPDIKEIAKRLVAVDQRVAHVEIDSVLFLRETETKANAAARCYKLKDHPIGFFTDKRFCIVVYQQNCDYMSRQQLAILVLHEMLHIPERGDKLVDHDIQDFRTVLGIDLDWSEPGREVPDLLGEVNGSKKQTKTDKKQKIRS